jgi:ankyrin repeat protein
MNASNKLAKHPPSELYAGKALEAAIAIQKRDSKALARLLQAAPGICKDRGLKELPLLVWAMGNDNSESFKMLLKAGASPDDYFFMQGVKMSVLTLATGAEKPDFFLDLLAAKANPNGLPESEPPLFTAFYCHKEDRFDHLVDIGADLNHADETGKTVLMVVCLARDYVKALSFVNRGAKLDAKMKNGTTLRRIIEKFPLNPQTEQGRAQLKLKAMIE